MSLVGKISKSRSQVEAEVALFNIIPNNPFGKFLLPIFANINPRGPQKWYINVLSNLILWPLSYFVLLVLRDQQTRRVTILAGVIDADNQEKVGLLDVSRPSFNVKGTDIESQQKKGLVASGADAS